MSDLSTWDLSRTALLTIDLQNDFLHPEESMISSIPKELTGVQDKVLQASVPSPIVSRLWLELFKPRVAVISRHSSRWSPIKTANLLSPRI